MPSIDETEAIIRTALSPLECVVERGPYQEWLCVKVYDTAGKLVDNLGTIRSADFREKVSLESILVSARERIASHGYSLSAWTWN
jgi:hypothetical protein